MHGRENEKNLFAVSKKKKKKKGTIRVSRGEVVVRGKSMNRFSPLEGKRRRQGLTETEEVIEG